ncbi:DUF429 domain-containing protein [Gordonia otitidis]|uniref:DUF429 domain-containing protein n=1 Tax=Gordonia otitidis (strain DSM 44809 / CCUG 52243 / JCM 12355 / NBRC 100426 / IFM 10032) TaxID=1108044 RepID=H5TGJ5_GORO1|nr:DUF429 domain-containing protein [Gordonia otitidis]GAB32603.1 hypothetical protein GOOTI_018_00070 [Gordonia otitidis NBRC 100426]
MLTAGVDLSASPASTAVAVVEWTERHARLLQLVTPADDSTIRQLVDGTDRCGIDSPFGWPDGFVEFVARHHRGTTPTDSRLDDIGRRRPLAYRRTDLYLVEHGLGRPLSVSADQIAHVAFRCAGLLADLDVTDRVDGWAVEAYPAGALKHWGLTSRGYKRSGNRAVLQSLCEDLQAAAPWLDLGPYVDLMCHDDNAFDAVVTALIARAASLGATTLPDEFDMPVAQREGWIHVPNCAFDDLR